MPSCGLSTTRRELGTARAFAASVGRRCVAFGRATHRGGRSGYAHRFQHPPSRPTSSPSFIRRATRRTSPARSSSAPRPSAAAARAAIGGPEGRRGAGGDGPAARPAGGDDAEEQLEERQDGPRLPAPVLVLRARARIDRARARARARRRGTRTRTRTSAAPCRRAGGGGSRPRRAGGPRRPGRGPTRCVCGRGASPDAGARERGGRSSGHPGRDPRERPEGVAGSSAALDGGGASR
jgi:hypothetical protein